MNDLKIEQLEQSLLTSTIEIGRLSALVDEKVRLLNEIIIERDRLGMALEHQKEETTRAMVKCDQVRKILSRPSDF